MILPRVHGDNAKKVLFNRYSLLNWRKSNFFINNSNVANLFLHDRQSHSRESFVDGNGPF